MSTQKLIDAQETSTVQCNQCQEPFEVDADADDQGRPVQVVDIPVECSQGNYCSDSCRAQAMYEQADSAGKETLRRYYLGAQLMVENRRPAEAIMQEWELDYDAVDCDSVACALSPDGGIYGKPGVEDDCEGVLLDKVTRQVVWQGLYMSRRAAIREVIEREQQVGQYPGVAYWQNELDEAKARLADAEAALATVSQLKAVV